MVEVRLRAMTQAEYDGWLDRAIHDYALEHVEAGTVAADGAEAWSAAEFGRYLPQGLASPGHHLLIGEADGERFGILWLHVSDDARRRAYVYDVEVQESQRGRGLGRGLMRAAEDYAQQHGATRIGLHVFGHNRVARSLYESLGYEVVGLNLAKALDVVDAAE